MKKILFLGAIAALICSCSKDDSDIQNPKAELVYRSFTATIDDITRVELTPNGDGTASAYWTKGDHVLFRNADGVEATLAVTSIVDGVATIEGNAPAGELTAYYPAWAYTDGSLSIPKTQDFSTSAPLAMTGTVNADNVITFTRDQQAAVLRIPVTGDIKLEKMLLYYTDNVLNFNGRNHTKNDYEMNDISRHLSSEPLYVYFLVPAGSKYLTLEFQSSTIPQSAKDMFAPNSVPGKVYGSNNLGYRYMRRLSTKAAKEFNGIVTLPATSLLLDELDATRYIVHFGSAYENDNKKHWVGLTSNNTVTEEENCAVVSLNVSKDETKEGVRTVTYRGDFGTNVTIPIAPGNYRYFAIKTDALNVTQNTAIWSNTAKNCVKFNPTSFGAWNNRSCKKSEDFSYVNTTGCTGDVQILVFDAMGKYATAIDGTQYMSTSKKYDLKCTFTVADMPVNDPADDFVAPVYRVYWAGFFTSIDEITEYSKLDNQ